jgi:hypothetical protein
MFRKMTQVADDRFADHDAQAEDCQHIADRFEEDGIGQEFAELARRWRMIAKQSGSTSR